MSELTLFFFPTTCSHVTMSALEEAGASYEPRAVNLATGEHKDPDYLLINPRGKVPALAIDNRILTENAVILAYLDRRFPAARLLPRDGGELDLYQGWADLVWCSNTLHPVTRQIYMPGRFTKDEPEGVRRDGMEKFAVECTGLCDRLTNRPWWYGNHWSIVDTYLYWLCASAQNGGFQLDDFPAITAHAGRIRARPAFQRVREKELAAARSFGLDVEKGAVLRLS